MPRARLRILFIAVLGVSIGMAAGLAPAFSQVESAAQDVHCVPRGCVDQRDLSAGSVSKGKIDEGAVTSAKIRDGGVLARDMADGSIDGAAVQDGSIQVADLAFDPLTQEDLDALVADLETGDGNGPNTGSNQVHWNNLTGVPADFADGNDAAGVSAPAGPATDVTCSGCVGTTDLADDAATQAELDAVEDKADAAQDDADAALTGLTSVDTRLDTAETTLGSLAAVAFSGDYSDLTGTPSLAAIATTGDWDDLTDVPSDIADGDDIDGGTAADVDCTGCLTADDLALDSVGASELGDGAVDTAALQDGAVTTDKMEANYSIASPTGGSITTASGLPAHIDVATATILFSEDSVHNVMLNGQALVDCPLCSAGDSATVMWELLRDGVTIINTQTTATLDANGALLPTPVTFVDTTIPHPTAPGDYAHAYTLRVRVTAISEGVPGTIAVNIAGGQLNAVDIGLAAP